MSTRNKLLELIAAAMNVSDESKKNCWKKSLQILRYDIVNWYVRKLCNDSESYGLFQDNVPKFSNWFIYTLENDNLATTKI
jgi:hypothetical protein